MACDMAHAVATSPPIAIEGNERGACVSDLAMFGALYEDDQAPTSIGNVRTVHSNTSTVRSLIGSSSHVACASGLACVANQRTLYGSVCV